MIKNKHSKKLFNIMLSALMMLGINLIEAEAANYGKNGVAYVLLNEKFSPPSGSGVYRFNNWKGDVANPFRVFTNLYGAQGLAADQSEQTRVYLLKSNGASGPEYDAPVGYLPGGVTFPDNSPIYVKVAKPSELGGNYSKPRSAHGTGYWKSNYTINGTRYAWAVVFGGPTGVYYLNGSSGTRGTPMWNGTGHIQHPTDSHKIILPSHWSAVSYYLMGTTSSPGHFGKLMNGDGVPEYTYKKANKMGCFMHNGDSNFTDNNPGHRCFDNCWYFGCIIKRIYKLTDKTMAMYRGIDKTNTLHSNMPATGMSLEQDRVLLTHDVRVQEFYGKWCGDDCIPGGPLPDNMVAGFLSNITVISTTTGNRYGFNHEGDFAGGGGDITKAALRVIKNVGGSYVTSPINISGLANITNRLRFTSPSEIMNIGVSSRFNGGTYDYIYGSKSDQFCVQDSWWGLGGVAYEYDAATKNVTKFDYIQYPNDPGTVVGTLKGSIDNIAIDGNAYLYALKTEVQPSDDTMKNAGNYIGTDPRTGNANVGGYLLYVSVGNWYRPAAHEGGSETRIAPDDVQPNDYRDIIVKQQVYKHLYRYPDATTGMGNQEDRGKIRAGENTGRSRLVRKSGYGATGTNRYAADFDVEVGSKVSSIRAELAVVNVADHPTFIEGTPETRYICGLPDSQFKSGHIVAEHDSLTFKAEGYKPFGYSFKNVGSFKANDGSTQLNNVRINSIQNADGEHIFDENEDSLVSGYDSNMFESDEKYTTVTWYVYKVENKSEAEYKANPKIIKKLVDGSPVKSNVRANCSFPYQFPDPGKYIIRATITYNYFSNFTTAERPENLRPAVKTLSIEPMLINVYARDLVPNNSPSYITNIKITKKNDRSSSSRGLAYDSSNPNFNKSSSDFDTAEIEAGNSPAEPKFGNLTIEFDAQFARSENDDNSIPGLLHTYDGIGAWDYQYYKELYKEAKRLGITGINVPSVSTNHVYNYMNTASVDDLLNSYSKSIYNPGFQKYTEETNRTYKGGTQRSGSPTKDDLKFIQWILYVRPITPQQEASTATLARGEVVASGDLTNSKITGGTNRKFHFSFDIKDIKSPFEVPRDCKNYALDLEFVYPRMTWLNNDLVSASDRPYGSQYYSSLVPYKSGGNKPVHVLSKIPQTVSGGILDWNDTNPAGEDPLFSDEPSVTLNVRDVVIPEFEDGNNVKDYIIRQGNYYKESTGDPIVSGILAYAVKDNNPFMQFKTPAGSPYTNPAAVKAITGMKESDAKAGINLYLERVKGMETTEPATLNSFSEEIDNKTLVKADSSPKECHMVPLDISTYWYKKPDWRLCFNYKETIKKLSGFNTQTFGNALTDISQLKDPIKTTNWIGELSYVVTGFVYDGIGVNGLNTKHYLYAENVPNAYYINVKDGDGNNYPLTRPQDYVVANKITFLKRYDNDPPSIGVQLISQNDKRKWDIQLLEGVNDRRNFAKTDTDLAPSKLIVSSYELSGSLEKRLSGPSVSNVSGSTNFYDKNGYDNPKFNDDTAPSLNSYQVNTSSRASIKFRKSARLLINVDIFDNCSFKSLKEAKITVSGEGLNFEQKINPEPSHGINGKLKENKFRNKPRGAFTVNLPPNGNSVTVTVFARDHEGNKREIIIPVTLVDSTFDKRNIENRERKL